MSAVPNHNNAGEYTLTNSEICSVIKNLLVDPDASLGGWRYVGEKFNEDGVMVVSLLFPKNGIEADVTVLSEEHCVVSGTFGVGGLRVALPSDYDGASDIDYLLRGLTNKNFVFDLLSRAWEQVDAYSGVQGQYLQDLEIPS